MREKKVFIDCVVGSRRLKTLREEKRLSHQALDELTGINKQSLINYERAGKEDGSEYGTRVNAFGGMSANAVVALAETLDVSTDYLLGLSNIKSPDADVQAICSYTGLSDKSVEMLHSLSYPDATIGDPEIIYAINLLLEALYKREDDGMALVDIARYLQENYEDITITSNAQDEDRVKKIAVSALEQEALNEITESLRWIKRKKMGEQDNGEHK